MTSSVLLLWIGVGIGVQLLLYLGIVFWQHWQDYTRLKAGISDLPRLAAAPAPEAAKARIRDAFHQFAGRAGQPRAQIHR